MAYFYALITSVATVTGGLLPIYTGFRNIELRYLIGFASGAMISIAFFEMIPEMGSGSTVALALAIGFYSLYTTEKFVMIHTCGEEECESHTMGWVAIIGIAAESLVDGIAIAVGYTVAPTLGLIIALAILIHEVPRGFSTAAIMKASNYSRKAVIFALAIDAGFTPLGVLFSGLFPPTFFKNIVAFTAGTFLYVGASDLLPEAHRRFNVKVIFSVLSGALSIPFLGALVRF